MQSILTGDNRETLETLYNSFLANPGSVDPAWAAFFRDLERNPGIPVASNGGSAADSSLLRQMGIQNLLNAYRGHGHLAADLDPLGMAHRDRTVIERRLANLNEADLNAIFDPGVPGLSPQPLRDIIARFEATYCDKIGAEHFYLVNDEERMWIQSRMEETANKAPLTPATRLRLFEKVLKAEYFEKFLAKKFIGKKRFSLEGSESVISLLDGIIETSGESGMHTIVIGMAHRGRLNVLENIFSKPASDIFAEFEEKADPSANTFADVKYHLGYSSVHKTASGKEVHLSLAFNPSHLEAVNPVVMGSVRARQTLHGDETRKRFMGILIHGDAAFVGQGVVAESLNLMNIGGYSIGGVIHIVINNQIGFTTLPYESRSTLYATDLAKGFQIPIFHVNGDDPEAVHRVMQLAVEYRQKFGKDVIIDLIGYRKLGHNETDEPAFTQPLMYDVIRNHPSAPEQYEKFLLSDPSINQAEIERIKKSAMDELEESFRLTHETDVRMKVDTMQGVWSRFSREDENGRIEEATPLSKNLPLLSAALTSLPADFSPHPKLQKFQEERLRMLSGERALDWATGEALAFGQAMLHGHNVRLSGQDSQRGTFSQRHAVFADVQTGRRLTLLNQLESKGRLEVLNSPLSEFSVMGFEYGFSLADPNTLVLWEGQFGDFVNGAQVIIDQFLSSSEYKWYRLSGLVLLLPHGYEGQGPEHSSARMERFLQLCANKNMRVVNCTTPANYFHVLTEQVFGKLRRPLIVFTPKSLLRHPMAVSLLSEFTDSAFQRVIMNKDTEMSAVKKLVLCSGKVYYDIQAALEKSKSRDITIARVEQLYPIPKGELTKVFEQLPSLKKVVWAQEEPKNMGAWFFIQDRLREMLPAKVTLELVSRAASPSPAAGMAKVHNREQEELIQSALS